MVANNDDPRRKLPEHDQTDPMSRTIAQNMWFVREAARVRYGAKYGPLMDKLVPQVQKAKAEMGTTSTLQACVNLVKRCLQGGGQQPSGIITTAAAAAPKKDPNEMAELIIAASLEIIEGAENGN